MEKRLKILMIAYYFPPDSSSGALRPLFFAKHLEDLGAKVTVLTAKEEYYLPEQPRDHDLVKHVKKNTDIVRVNVLRPREAVIGLKNKLFSQNFSAQDKKLDTKSMCAFPTHPGLSEKKTFYQQMKDTFTDLLSSPDPHVGWVPDAVRFGMDIIRRKNIDIIFATGSPWSSLIAGVVLKRKTGTPVILDFRDPWVSNPGFVQRGRIVSKIEIAMEEKVVSIADAIIANTEELRKDFLKKYSFLKKDRVHTVSNGFEGYISSSAPRNKRFTITHAGVLYFSRSPRELLEAILHLISKGKISHNEIQITFVGEFDIEDSRTSELIENLTLKGAMNLIPRVPYHEAIKYQLKSDVLLIIQPGFPLQIPRKLYEYMAMKRQIFAIADINSATTRIIKEYKLGCAVENERDAIIDSLLKMYNDWKKREKKPQLPNNLHDFFSYNLTKKLYSILCQKYL